MPNKILFVLFSMILLFTSSCDFNVLFKDAMPPDVEPIESIPSFFQGVYMCESDSSLMYIFSDRVCQESYVKFEVCTDNIDEINGCEITKEGIYIPSRDEYVPYEYIEEDRIVATIHDYDTLFYFSDRSIAKLYKGRLFLNLESKDQEWVTFMLSPRPAGAIAFDLIQVPDEIEMIEEITIDCSDVSYIGII